MPIDYSDIREATKIVEAIDNFKVEVNWNDELKRYYFYIPSVNIPTFNKDKHYNQQKKMLETADVLTDSIKNSLAAIRQQAVDQIKL